MSKGFSVIKVLLTTVLLAVGSWILVHVLAVFGIFVALALPLWWILAPKMTICMMCRSKKEGQFCPWCRREVHLHDGIYMENWRSAVLNGLIILLFTVISAVLVLGEAWQLKRMGFPPTKKTVSFSIPDKGQFRLGEIFPMKIEIVGIKVPINAVQADIGFNSDRLEVVDVSTTDSFANLFVQKEINNEAGFVRLTGGLPNPGYVPDRGLFGTIMFKSKGPGVAKIDFLPSSMVLANDGRGTNVLKDLASVNYLVLPERISIEEEKLQSNLAGGTAVLGAESDGTRMTFYEETKVLGADYEPKPVEKTHLGIIDMFLENLVRIDSFALSLWNVLSKIVDVFGFKINFISGF